MNRDDFYAYHLAEYGLVLYALAKEEAWGAGALASEIGFSTPRTVGILRRLCRQGYVRQERSDVHADTWYLKPLIAEAILLVGHYHARPAVMDWKRALDDARGPLPGLC